VGACGSLKKEKERFRIKMKQIIYLSFVTASVSFTVTEMKIFQSLREWLKKKNSFFGELLSCCYCFSHWVAAILVVIYQAKLFNTWWLLDYFLTVLVVAWLGSFQVVLMCWLTDKAGI